MVFAVFSARLHWCCVLGFTVVCRSNVGVYLGLCASRGGNLGIYGVFACFPTTIFCHEVVLAPLGFCFCSKSGRGGLANIEEWGGGVGRGWWGVFACRMPENHGIYSVFCTAPLMLQ